MVIASAALTVLIVVQFIDETKGHMAEVLKDRSVEVVELN